MEEYARVSKDCSLKGSQTVYVSSQVQPPDKLYAAPYCELTLPITKLQFRLGSHAWPFEQGRLCDAQAPRKLRRCSLCSTRSVGDERHYRFESPKFIEIRAQFAHLPGSSAGAMRSVVWHKEQQAVCDCMIAVIRLADMNNAPSSYLFTPIVAGYHGHGILPSFLPHRSGLAEWTS